MYRIRGASCSALVGSLAWNAASFHSSHSPRAYSKAESILAWSIDRPRLRPAGRGSWGKDGDSRRADRYSASIHTRERCANSGRGEKKKRRSVVLAFPFFSPDRLLLQLKVNGPALGFVMSFGPSIFARVLLRDALILLGDPRGNRTDLANSLD